MITEDEIKYVGDVVKTNDIKIIHYNILRNPDEFGVEEGKRNIYAFDSNGKFLWQVYFAREIDEVKSFSEDTFVSLNLERDQVFSTTYSGFKYKIDLLTGAATRVSFVK